MALTLRSVAGPFHGTDVNTLQVILHGTSLDLAYQASSGSSVSAGPFGSSCVRVAIPDQKVVRINHGSSGVTATPTNCPMFVGPGIEHIAINPGEYIAAISNDANTGTINLTAAN